jgi:hypothetical protein
MDELLVPSLLAAGGAAVVLFSSALVYLQSLLRFRA